MEKVDRDFLKVILILAPTTLIAFTAMGLGTCAFGPRGDLSGRSPALVARSELTAEDLTFCLGKDWARRLSLQRVGTPEAPRETTRFHNPVSKITVDVTDFGAHREIRAYSRDDRPLLPAQSAAITDCAASLNKALGAGFPKT